MLPTAAPEPMGLLDLMCDFVVVLSGSDSRCSYKLGSTRTPRRPIQRAQSLFPRSPPLRTRRSERIGVTTDLVTQDVEETMAVDKVIVMHAGALRNKYGAVGVIRICAAIDAMVAADAGRGVTTRVVSIDSTRDMSGRGRPTGTPATPRQAKAAIDAIYAADRPDYIMLLGAPDVIPLQSLSDLAPGRGSPSCGSVLIASTRSATVCRDPTGTRGLACRRPRCIRAR